MTLTNRAATALTIGGLYDRSAVSRARSPWPPVRRPRITFRAGAPGTYFYWATAGEPFETRTGTDSQLNGAFVVDPAERRGRRSRLRDQPLPIGGADRPRLVCHQRPLVAGHGTPRVSRRRIGALAMGEPVEQSASASSSWPVLPGREGRRQSRRDRSPRSDARPLVVTENLQIARTLVMEWTSARGRTLVAPLPHPVPCDSGQPPAAAAVVLGVQRLAARTAHGRARARHHRDGRCDRGRDRQPHRAA